MSWDIESLTLCDDTIQEMGRIGKLCFGNQYSTDHLRRNWQLCDPGSRFFGIRDAGNLIAFNGFLKHRAKTGVEESWVFQSCHSATHPGYRGKGLFSSIIRGAKENLRDDGQYIVGFPNNKSAPIFVNKLGFRQVDLVRLYIAKPLGLFSKLLFRNNRLVDLNAHPDRVEVDFQHSYDWKSKEHGNQIIRLDQGSNSVWGRTHTKNIFGKQSKYFHVGNIKLDDPNSLSNLMHRLSETADVGWVRIVCTESSPLIRASRQKFSGAHTEPLIWFPLGNAHNEPVFDVHSGIKDVF